MDTLPVTLIVKAPNQQIEDQTIKCELSWSINMLKQHLSEVYPNKPPQTEQKLIYSGQLLSDSVILKDVLRQYGEQNTHTLHLVCTPKYTVNNPTPQPAVQTTTPRNVPVPVQPEVTPNIPYTNEDQRVPNLDTIWMQSGYNTQYNVQQFMLMQQAYVAYMQHYMNIAHLQQFGSPMPGLNLNPFPTADLNHPVVDTPTNQPPPTDDAQPEPEQQLEPPPAAAPQPAVAVAAVPAIALHQRDWLDHFYLLCRVLIFISIVYFYSSAARFIVVFFTAACLYLYQIGFFRHVHVNNNNLAADVGNNGAGGGAGGGGGPGGVATEQAVEEPVAPSRLMIVWTFVTTFLASLLPEIPNVV